MDDVKEWPKLSHEPIHAVRGTPATDPGEHAYLEEWHAVVRAEIPFDECEDEADQELGPLNRILIAIPGPLGDQESRWAAEFVKWLGTNVGMSVGIGRGSRYDERVRDQVLMRWTECNARRTWVNHGYRVSDYLTSPNWNDPAPCREAMALEVFDQLALWLGSSEGQEFIERAETRFRDYAMARRQRSIFDRAPAAPSTASSLTGANIGGAAVTGANVHGDGSGEALPPVDGNAVRTSAGVR